MGVFARLFGKSKTTEEKQSAEAEATQVRDAAEAEAAVDEVKEAAESKGPTEPMDAGAGSEAAAEQTAAEEVTAEQTAPAIHDEGVGIPKQQSAEEVADSEADEGART